jgi:hypothetical protein
MSPDRIKREIAAVFEVIRNRTTDDEVYILCPVPGCGDKTGNRSINVKTLRTHCWRCSDPQPHHLKTLFRLLGHEMEDYHTMELSELEALLRGEVSKPVTPVQDIPLPEGFKPLSQNRKSCYWRFCRDMAERKHLTIEDLEEAQAGFTRSGDWEPYCIFPVREGPRTVYYQGRTYTDDGFETTKKFPSKKEVPYGPAYWVYNLDAVADLKVQLVIVVESILNMLTLHRKLRELDLHQEIISVCVFTHRLSRAQVTKFQRYPHVKEFCLLFDSDSTALANKTALALGSTLPLTVAAMPHGVNPDGTVRVTNDANDDVEAALGAVADRQPPSSVTALQAKLNEPSPMKGPLYWESIAPPPSQP